LGKSWKIKVRKKVPSIRGAGNPQWKGGKTDLGRAIRSLPEYTSWRTDVFQRDKWTCVQCRRKGCRKVIIHTDHVQRFADLIEKFSIKTTGDAIACAALWDVNNGRTLCIDCHKQTPTWGVNYPAAKDGGASCFTESCFRTEV
jgi:hypothetical protein